MQTEKSCSPSRPDAMGIKKALAANRHLISGPGQPAAIVKNGTPIAEVLAPALRVQEMLVSPEMARLWLKNNFRNRRMKEDTIKAYARDMRSGSWVFTHQGIAFNDRDELIDGQHRLSAIVLAGVSVRMMVTFGLPSQIDGKEATTMDAVDRGATRSVGDQLKIQHGMEQGGLITAMAAALGSVCLGEKTRRLSVGQTLEVYREFEAAILYVMERRSKHHGLRQVGFWAGFAFALAAESDKSPVKGWLDDFSKGEKLGGPAGRKSPILLLRSFATGEQSVLFTKTMNRGLVELTLQAIWLEKTGALVTALEPGLDGFNYFAGLQKERVQKIAAIFQLPGKVEAKPAREESAACPPRAPVKNNGAAAQHRPALDQIVTAAEKHFGIGKVILLNRRANDEMVVSCRNCLLRCMEELGHGKNEIAAATGFEVNSLTAMLAVFADDLKFSTRQKRKYEAFRKLFS
jgi:hypothetical protein